MKIPPQNKASKRKLPGFIVHNEARKAKKVVSFEDCVSTSRESSSLGVIAEKSDDAASVLEVVAEWDEPEEEPSDQEADKSIMRLEQMYDVFRNLNQECEERKRSVRLDSGEIMEGKTPPSSQDSNSSWEFELAFSSASDEVPPNEIFDFIWKYISDHQRDIYGRIGTGAITRDMAEDFLVNAPSDLLQILEIALVEAERKINQFSV
jgi:hypothetical protein